MTGKAYKQVMSTGTPEDLITMAVEELQELGEELQAWADSMADTNLANGEKHSQIEEAAQTLSDVSEPSVDDWPNADARVPYTEEVPRRKARQPSRQVRFNNAKAKIDAVIEFYSALDEDHEELVGELEAIIDGDIDIPGAFG